MASDGSPQPLAGLTAPSTATSPAERRRWLTGLPPADLADRLVQLAAELRDAGADGWVGLAACVGLPLAEALASPFALRAVALAAESGAHFLDHELRAQPPWPSEWSTSQDVADEAHATWDRGALQVGKYQSFLQDDPLSTFNPNHMSKWGPHELLHRVCRFFFHPRMTPWELYLGARLNELVPVVFWYGPDEVMRLDRAGFRRERDAADREARLGSAQWLVQSEADLTARAEPDAACLLAGVRHFETELAAIDQEIAFGRQVRTPHALPDATLDASTDAIAYVVGHGARLKAAGTASLVAGLLQEGRHYLATVRTYRDHIEHVFDRLLFGTLHLHLDRSAARASGRRLWDLFARAAQCGDRAFGRVEALLPEARAALDAAWDGAAPDLDAWAQRLRATLGSRMGDVVLAAGDVSRDGGADFGLLAEGLESAVPATLALLGDASATAERLARSSHLRRRRSLAERLRCHLGESGAPPTTLDLLAFETGLLEARRRSDQVERLSVQTGERPPDWERGWIVANDGFVVLALDSDAAAAHAAWAETGTPPIPEPKAATYLLGAYLDGIAVLPAPEALIEAWRALETAPLRAGELIERLGAIPTGRADWPVDAAGWLEELMEAGAVGWFPAL